MAHSSYPNLYYGHRIFEFSPGTYTEETHIFQTTKPHHAAFKPDVVTSLYRRHTGAYVIKQHRNRIQVAHIMIRLFLSPTAPPELRREFLEKHTGRISAEHPKGVDEALDVVVCDSFFNFS